MIIMNIKIPKDIKVKAKAMAAILNVDLKDFVAMAMAEKVERENKKLKRMF